MTLDRQHCIPCRRGDPGLSESQIRELHQQVSQWTIQVRDGVQQLEKVFKFKNFNEALNFTMSVGNLAEVEDHHPSLTTEWGRVTVTWWTHAVQGLHQNDFIMAARTDLIYQKT